MNERFKDQSGEWGDRANYFDITVWGKRGETCAEYLTKGRPVAVQGSLRWREWESDDGGKRQAVEVVADNVQFLNKRGDDDSFSGGGGGGSGRSDVPADTSDFEPDAPVGDPGDDIPV